MTYKFEYQSNKPCSRCRIVKVFPKDEVCEYCQIALSDPGEIDPAKYATWDAYFRASMIAAGW